MTSSQRILITVIVLLLGIGVLVAIVALPSIHGILQLADNITRERERIQPIVSRALRFNTISSDVKRIQKDLPSLRKLFISEGQEVAFFTTLGEVSRRLGLTQTLRLGDGQKNEPGNTSTFPLDLELQGDYRATLQYLAELERMPELISFDVINMRVAPPSGITAPSGHGALHATLHGMITIAPAQ